MPTYEYECLHCAHNFEVFQNMNDKRLDKCPKCNKKVKRVIGAGAGIIFKGAGFYATDYRKPIKDNSEKKPNEAPVCPKIKEGCTGCKH